MTPNKGSGPQCEFNRARKIKSDVQVAINKNSDPMHKFSLGVAGRTVPPTDIFFKLLETS